MPAIATTQIQDRQAIVVARHAKLRKAALENTNDALSRIGHLGLLQIKLVPCFA